MTIEPIAIGKYVLALMTWAVVARRPVEEVEKLHVACTALFDKFGRSAVEMPDVFCKFMQEQGRWSIDLYKSCLLARLIYGQEPLRTRPCPTHKGRWSGCGIPCPHGCYFGSNVTGWLPEPAPGKDGE